MADKNYYAKIKIDYFYFKECNKLNKLRSTVTDLNGQQGADTLV